jgi:dipeptidyl aminopeptidase/acylaminoacyl peptidase
LFADALKKNGVNAELLLYEKGGHGFGLVNPTSEIQWIEQVAEWIKKLQ